VWDDGWQIAYLVYESAAPDALPTLIELRRDDIDVRLKIDTWQID
jgi:outer membrane biogenesis lipoprotein LolB